MSIGRLLQFARQTVEFVKAQLMQQLNVVEEQGYNLMRAQVQQVVGGIWIGKGADVFVETVERIMMPKASAIITHINADCQRLDNAIRVIDAADQAVQQKAKQISDVFQSII